MCWYLCFGRNGFILWLVGAFAIHLSLNGRRSNALVLFSVVAFSFDLSSMSTSLSSSAMIPVGRIQGDEMRVFWPSENITLIRRKPAQPTLWRVNIYDGQTNSFCLLYEWLIYAHDYGVRNVNSIRFSSCSEQFGPISAVSDVRALENEIQNYLEFRKHQRGPWNVLRHRSRFRHRRPNFKSWFN